jgi:hypothetical protein
VHVSYTVHISCIVCRVSCIVYRVSCIVRASYSFYVRRFAIHRTPLDFVIFKRDMLWSCDSASKGLEESSFIVCPGTIMAVNGTRYTCIRGQQEEN